MVMSIAACIESAERFQRSSPSLSNLTAVPPHLQIFAQGRVDASRQDWELLQYLKNGGEGVSAALLRARRSDPAHGLSRGAFVLAFHSTEPNDPLVASPPSDPTPPHAWKPGQIAEMEVWFASLRFCGVIGANPVMRLIGHSTGRHLVLAGDAQHGAGADAVQGAALWPQPAASAMAIA